VIGGLQSIYLLTDVHACVAV